MPQKGNFSQCRIGKKGGRNNGTGEKAPQVGGRPEDSSLNRARFRIRIISGSEKKKIGVPAPARRRATGVGYPVPADEGGASGYVAQGLSKGRTTAIGAEVGWAVFPAGKATTSAPGRKLRADRKGLSTFKRGGTPFEVNLLRGRNRDRGRRFESLLYKKEK